MAQASAIATLEQIAPGRLMVGFGTGFTGRAGMGKSKENSRRPGVGVGGLISCWVRGVDTMLSGPVKIQYANTNYFRKFTPTN